MVYVRPDGSVSDRRSIWRVIEDFIYGVIGAISLFVTAIFNPPQLENRSNSRAYRQYQPAPRSSRPHGSNIRGVGSLQKGSCGAPVGGG